MHWENSGKSSGTDGNIDIDLIKCGSCYGTDMSSKKTDKVKRK